MGHIGDAYCYALRFQTIRPCTRDNGKRVVYDVYISNNRQRCPSVSVYKRTRVKIVLSFWHSCAKTFETALDTIVVNLYRLLLVLTNVDSVPVSVVSRPLWHQ